MGSWLKRLIALAALAVLLYFFWPLISELRKAGPLFSNTKWGWLGAAVLIHTASYISLAQTNRVLLRPFEGKISLWRMLAILPAFAFISTAIPSAGASGVVLRVRYLRQCGYTPESAVFTLVLETIFLATVMTMASLLGVGYLLSSLQLSPIQIAFLLAGALVLLVLFGILVYSGMKQQRLRRLALLFADRWNRLAARLRKPPILEQSINQRIDSFYSGLSNYTLLPLFLALVLTISCVILDVISLAACFFAFTYSIPWSILLTGYGLMWLLSGLSILPGGLGMADLSLAVVFARLGAPGVVAVAAALAYRLLAFWLLRFIGFIAWQVLEARYKSNA